MSFGVINLGSFRHHLSHDRPLNLAALLLLSWLEIYNNAASHEHTKSTYFVDILLPMFLKHVKFVLT